MASVVKLESQILKTLQCCVNSVMLNYVRLVDAHLHTERVVDSNIMSLSSGF